ncbi:MAG TPA: serine hydrolase domain-containing protein [Burkholderiales bacterium]|nr:serine hydrolase domain-containing protein [Burkholderiales bacterium]
MTGILRSASFAAISFAIALGGCATGLRQAASPEAAGLSSERIKELSVAFQNGVDRKEIPGAVILIARHGKIGYFEAFGYRDREAGAPMGRDAIFRIASMTKPVTIVAAMTLVEQGRLNLSDPVSRYLPEFKDAKVGVEQKDAAGKPVLVLETPHREMTVLDLMRHTSGLTYGFTGKSLVRDRYAEEKIDEPGLNNAAFVSRLARAPLQNQPGEVWDYSVSTDVLGRIVEVVSGMELEQYFAERIFKPLGMTDTGFWVSDPAKRSRIAEVQADPATGKRPATPDKTVQSRQGGGGALVSTAGDYARFCQMLLNGGELDGARIISRGSVGQMTKNQLPPGIKINFFPIPVLDVRPEAGNGFGLNLMVRTADGRGPIPGNVGDYTWPGIFGTQFWVDPKKELVVVMMIQVPAGAGRIRTQYWTQTRELVYRTLAD